MLFINSFVHTIYFSCFPISQLLSTFLFPNNKTKMLKQNIHKNTMEFILYWLTPSVLEDVDTLGEIPLDNADFV